MSLDDLQMPRQQVLRGAGLVLAAGALAACGKNSDSADASAETSTDDPTAGPPAAEQAIAQTADVPVGGGVIVGDVVVTQPAAGTFNGFSAKCTHAGCTLNKIADGTIDCPCHGSRFYLDGTVAKGPATKPLESRAVVVQGDSIVLA